MESLIGPAFTLSIAVTVLGYGLSANNDDILYVFRRARLLVVSLLAMFIIMPFIALALELYFDFPHATRVALVALALTPVSSGLPKKEISAGGRPSYAYGLSVVVSALSIVIVPALVAFLGRLMSRPFGIPMSTLAVTLLTQILLPLAIGLLIQRFLPQVAERIRAPIVKAGTIVLWVVLILVLIPVFPSVIEVTTWRTVAGMAAFIAAGLVVGHFMGGPDPDHSVVLAIACSNRNPGMAIAIASANFPAEDFTATMVLYGFLVGFVSKPYINWQTRRLVAAPQTEPHGAEQAERP